MATMSWSVARICAGRSGLVLIMAMLGVSGAPSSLGAQVAHEHGHHHVMPGGSGDGWVMPPMAMPMVQEMEALLPSVQPYLPGSGMDVSALPLAEPSRTVEVVEGDTLELVVSLVRREILGRQYVMYGYNGQYPGPGIRARVGSSLTIRVVNQIELPTTVHWHGVRLDYRFDGVPGLPYPAIAPGESFVYEVSVPDAGLFWYHPHVREDVQQGLGLYGNLLVTGDREADEGARVNQVEMLVLADLLMSPDGRLVPFGQEHPTHALMGRFGNVLLTNGKTDHRITVDKNAVVRFHLTNVANARTFNVVFGDMSVKLIGSDLSSFQTEAWVPGVVIAPAERYTVEARFSEPGLVAITNTIQATDKWRGIFRLRVDTLALVEVRDAAVQKDHGERFRELAQAVEVMEEIDRYRLHFDREPDHELVLTLRTEGLPLPVVQMMEIDTLFVPPVEWNDPMPMMNWVSTGREVEWILREVGEGRENEDIHWEFRKGDVVKIRIFNDPKSFHPMNHPIHLHGQRFLVLERDGVRQENLVWKDTAMLPAGSTMDLLVEMSNPGEWMFHCHIPEHMQTGMMFSFRVLEGQ